MTKPKAKLRNASSSGKISKNEGNMLQNNFNLTMLYKMILKLNIASYRLYFNSEIPIEFVKGTNRCLLTSCCAMCKFGLRSMFKIRISHFYLIMWLEIEKSVRKIKILMFHSSECNIIYVTTRSLRDIHMLLEKSVHILSNTSIVAKRVILCWSSKQIKKDKLMEEIEFLDI